MKQIRSSVPRTLRYTVLASGILLALSAQAQQGQEANKSDKEKTLETMVVTGSRAHGHTASETPAPVDIITAEQLRETGALEVGQILQQLEPSFNFSRTWISDGTDIIRPATLRGLGPDQVLILVNGKRRHQQALVNVQQTVGRGSAGTDINAIPVSAIKRIEVLRDGAAAEYGSDAISGVINIILKDQKEGGLATIEAGQTYEGDGENYHAAINDSIPLGDGFINLTGEYRKRYETNRAGKDELRVDPPRVTQRIGDPDATDRYLWLNSVLPAGDGEFYFFGGISRRSGDSSGFFRSAGDGRTVPQLYPNGFLPNIITTVRDWSAAGGYRMKFANGWDLDLSVNHGQSKFEFDERNSVNVSWYYEPKPGGGIYGESPTSADTGTLKFDQTTFNADLKGSFDWGHGAGPLYVATGYEYRRDNYQIDAGDPVSYTYGRTNNGSIVIRNQNGGFAAPGIQGFPGFTPGTEVDRGRHNNAVFVEAENQLSEHFMLSGAIRYEDYSDFGNTTTGKVNFRWDPTDQFGLRGTLSNGFRAPGVQQEFYSQVSTNLNAAGVLTDTLTARQDSSVTRAFGISPLKEEKSHNGSIGFVYRPDSAFTFTVDAFRTTIDNRIIFSSNIQPEDPSTCNATRSNCPILQILEPFHVGQVLFFTNAIDTRTNGLDLVGDYHTTLSNGDTLDLNAALNFNRTKVTKRRSQSAILPANVLFDDTQVTLIEKGQPRQHHVLSATWGHDAWSVNTRANYYGEVEGQGFTPGIIETWGGKWLFDLTATWKVNDAFSVTGGGNNIFDTYPDKWDRTRGFPFPQLGFTYCWETCPFGVNGGSYFVRLDYKF